MVPNWTDGVRDPTFTFATDVVFILVLPLASLSVLLFAWNRSKSPIKQRQPRVILFANLSCLGYPIAQMVTDSRTTSCLAQVWIVFYVPPVVGGLALYRTIELAFAGVIAGERFERLARVSAQATPGQPSARERSWFSRNAHLFGTKRVFLSVVSCRSVQLWGLPVVHVHPCSSRVWAPGSC